jgi:hypothetical protein
MTSPKDSQPTQVTNSFEGSSSNTIYIIVCNGSSVESGGASVGDSVGGCETTEPVANPISITSPDEDLNTGLND